MEKMKLGIIGMGEIGIDYARKALDEDKCSGVMLLAVCDSDPKSLEKAQDEMPDSVKIYSNAVEMLDSGTVDSCIICSSNYERMTYLAECAKRNINVMIVNPVGAYTKQISSAAAELGKSKSVICTAFEERTDPLYIRLKRIIDSGEFGKIKRMSMIYTDCYRTNAYYDGEKGAFKTGFATTGGGIIINECFEKLDMICSLIGLPKTVQSVLHMNKHRKINCEDDAFAYFEFENGVTGTFTTSIGDAPGTDRFEIDFDCGKIVCEDGILKIWQSETAESEWASSCAVGVEKPEYEYYEYRPKFDKSGKTGIINSFADKVNGEDGFAADIHEAKNALTLCNAIYLSAFLGRTVEIPFDEDLYYKELLKAVKATR